MEGGTRPAEVIATPPPPPIIPTPPRCCASSQTSSLSSPSCLRTSSTAPAIWLISFLNCHTSLLAAMSALPFFRPMLSAMSTWLCIVSTILLTTCTCTERSLAPYRVLSTTPPDGGRPASGNPTSLLPRSKVLPSSSPSSSSSNPAGACLSGDAVDGARNREGRSPTLDENTCRLAGGAFAGSGGGVWTAVRGGG